ncbi:MAG: SCO family protein [Jatrophihabitantaceae bacterium]
MIRRARPLFAASLLALATMLAGCTSATTTAANPPVVVGSGASGQPSGLSDNTGSGPYQGTGLDPAQPRPSFTLTDTAGKSFAFGSRTAGRPTLLYFGYTNCPDVCPTTMADIQLALQKLPVTLQEKVDVVFVTTDVKHDTAAVLTKWLSNFSAGVHATFVGLRGTQAQIDTAQASAHIFLAEDGGQTHSTQVLLYGPDDYAHVSFIYSGGTGAETGQIAHDLPVVAKS